ncbi:aromatic ring-hydroxylating dioxygenase subunit alpha [Mycolicibacterium sp. 050158]|uniref:aromatic ring-hydroxylating oxygenase subunit alpha n=1 Tax=Mycolicibacterium sp. 050158 TaxID=3090602 RepID=UPI00299EB3E2|nr:aromatic ring-hydroxylating dioxygenase subunit alpha [Mycolicibacterium sp. 050158]MDX1892182.1 aromatic ring-hydroxylating dioxygenase subunit alpha [Mycolicibacterium sp. 050158]
MAFDYSRMTATCAVDSPANAVTLPPEAYGSDELYADEVDRIFKRGWIPLCRLEQIPTDGSYYSIDILGTPLVVTRDRHSEIRVLSRNCTHRWMELCSGAGAAKVLQCPYHLWSFGLDGHLAGAPEMKQTDGFNRADFGLKQFRHELWKGFVFVNLDGQASPLAEQLAELSAVVDPYDFENYQTVEHTEWGECEWDWKIMVDNFMECYHHMGPHRGTLEDEFPAHLSSTGEVGPYFTTMWSAQAPGYPVTAPFMTPGADTLTPEHSRKSLIFIAYPLLQIAMGPGYMYWLKVLPLGAGRIEVHLDIAMSPAALAAPELEERRNQLVKSICDIHREDLDVCASVQRAIKAGVTGVGRLSHLERPLWEFYRYLGRELGLTGHSAKLASTG